MSQSSLAVKARYRERNRPTLRVKGLEYYYANKDKLRAKHLRLRYGITPEDYDRMDAGQNSLCYLCGLPERSKNYRNGSVNRLAVDHNHTTGRARKLLCHSCNSRLSFVENCPELLAKMHQYLSEHG